MPAPSLPLLLSSRLPRGRPCAGRRLLPLPCPFTVVAPRVALDIFEPYRILHPLLDLEHRLEEPLTQRCSPASRTMCASPIGAEYRAALGTSCMWCHPNAPAITMLTIAAAPTAAITNDR